jgi:hypothetical protein
LRQLVATTTSESNQINFDRNMQGKNKGNDKQHKEKRKQQLSRNEEEA